MHSLTKLVMRRFKSPDNAHPPNNQWIYQYQIHCNRCQQAHTCTVGRRNVPP